MNRDFEKLSNKLLDALYQTKQHFEPGTRLRESFENCERKLMKCKSYWLWPSRYHMQALRVAVDEMNNAFRDYFLENESTETITWLTSKLTVTAYKISRYLGDWSVTGGVLGLSIGTMFASLDSRQLQSLLCFIPTEACTSASALYTFLCSGFTAILTRAGVSVVTAQFCAPFLVALVTAMIVYGIVMVGVVVAPHLVEMVTCSLDFFVASVGSPAWSAVTSCFPSTPPPVTF